MPNWKPDERFLEFLVHHYQKRLTFLDVGVTAKHLGIDSFIDEIRKGTPRGRQMYEALYNLPEAQSDYKKYLKATTN